MEMVSDLEWDFAWENGDEEALRELEDRMLMAAWAEMYPEDFCYDDDEF